MVDDLPAVPESVEDLGAQIGRELPSRPLAVIAAGAHEGDVGRLDTGLQQGVHHHREDDLHGACRTGGIIEADRDPHARLREILQRRGSVGLLDGLAGRDSGTGQFTRVVELDHGGVLGNRNFDRAISEVHRSAPGAHHEPALGWWPSAVSSAISAGPKRALAGTGWSYCPIRNTGAASGRSISTTLAPGSARSMPSTGPARTPPGTGTQIPTSALAITPSPAGHGAIVCSAVYGRAMSYRHLNGIRRTPRSRPVGAQVKCAKGTSNADASNTDSRASSARHAATRIRWRSVANAADSVRR